MHIELTWLEQLIAFADCGTLSAAAEQLLLSQPALSQSMKRLEETIGVPLFDRTKNRLMLNENGKQAVIYAKGLLEQEKSMIDRIRLFDHSNHTISLGVCAPVPLWDIVPLLSQYFRGMRISSEMKNRDEELLEDLEKGAYQIVVVHTKPDAAGVFLCLIERRGSLFLYHGITRWQSGTPFGLQILIGKICCSIPILGFGMSCAGRNCRMLIF